MAIASINPATGEKLKEFSSFDDAEIEKRLTRAEKAFRNFRRTTFTERAELLHGLSDLLFQETKGFAEIITLEMGKLFRDSLAEIEKCARGCRFYAENGARFLEEEPAQTDAAESYVEYQPLGPVLAVMPWNFPFWQVFRFTAPALVAGNQRRRSKSKHLPERKIPRHHREHRSEWLILDVTFSGIGLRRLLLEKSRTVLGVKATTTRTLLDFRD